MSESPESTFDFDQLLQTVRRILDRRLWWVIGSAFLIPLGTIAALYQLPNRYTSEATLLVVGQQVPERYVTPTSSTDMSAMLETMRQDVLSRGRLLALINELGLYPKQKNRLAPEELVDLMRRDVEIEPLQTNTAAREVNAFRISYISDNPLLAQEVTSRLTRSFIEQNLKSRADQASTTTRFLHEQLDSARATLLEQEQRLRDFKMKYLGELPEQLQGNLNVLAGLQNQLQSVMLSANRARQQRTYLESLLAEYKRLAGRRSPLTPGAVPDTESVSPLHLAERDLARLQAERRKLLTLYTDQHPEVQKKDREITDQQSIVDKLASLKPLPLTSASLEKPQPTEPDTSNSPELNQVTVQMKGQLEVNRLEVESLNDSERKLREEIDRYQSRLNLTPVREQQVTSMLRDYELSKQNYADLLSKQMQSQMATNLEKRQEGQQFRLADPPNLPTVPSSPKRLKISLGSLAGGLAVGLAFAFLAEIRRPSFHTNKEAELQLGVPFVIGIPLLVTAQDKRQRTWKHAIEWCALSVVLVAVSAAEYYVYRHG